MAEGLTWVVLKNLSLRNEEVSLAVANQNDILNGPPSAIRIFLCDEDGDKAGALLSPTEALQLVQNLLTMIHQIRSQEDQ
jgi:hypothetical protein